MNTVSDDSLARIIEHIERAGKTLAEFWPGNAASPEGGSLQVQKKPDGSFVTEADFASNAIIVAGIREIFPADAIISEELPFERVLLDQRVWLIDPLDGTSWFIKGRNHFSILVALCEAHAVELGIVHFPVLGLLAQARRGAGSFLNGRKLAVSDVTTLGPGSVYYRNISPGGNACFYRDSVDSGLGFLGIAEGKYAGMIIRIEKHQEWDLAAPIAILEEAGGTVSDELGQPLQFTPAGISFRYLIASNGRVHDQLLQLIETLPAS